MSDGETPTLRTLSSHSGAAYEAGSTGLPRGEQLEGAAVNDRREHVNPRPERRGITGYLTGANAEQIGAVGRN